MGDSITTRSTRAEVGARSAAQRPGRLGAQPESFSCLSTFSPPSPNPQFCDWETEAREQDLGMVEQQTDDRCTLEPQPQTHWPVLSLLSALYPLPSLLAVNPGRLQAFSSFTQQILTRHWPNAKNSAKLWGHSGDQNRPLLSGSSQSRPGRAGGLVGHTGDIGRQMENYQEF